MARRGSREKGRRFGCMNGVLHFLDIHRLLFAGAGNGGGGGGVNARRTSTPAAERRRDQLPDRLKGIEAPRNSLDKTEESGLSSFSFSQGEYFELPMGIQVERTTAFLSEEDRRSSESTPRTTSNVVARLMGLDELPENAPHSPVIYSHSSTPPPLSFLPTLHVASAARRHHLRTKKEKKDQVEPKAPPRLTLESRSCNASSPSSRSLPETPRGSASSSGKPWLDVPSRLSLQNFTNNKENVNPKETTKGFTYFRNEAVCWEQSQAPASRLNFQYCYQDENIGYSRDRETVKKLSESVARKDGLLIDGGSAAGKRRTTRTAPSPPPLGEVVVFKENGPTKLRSTVSTPLRSPRKITKSFNEAINAFSATNKAELASKAKQQQPSRTQAKTKTSVMEPNSKSKRFTENMVRPSPPRSPDMINPMTAVRQKIQTPTFSPMKDIKKIVEGGDAKEQDQQLRYVKSILERAGFSSDGSHKIKWHSPSRPLDPIIFHQLELQLDHHHRLAGEKRAAAMRHRWNRKLLFHLVDEILRDYLGPRRFSGGEGMLRRVWETIRSFPTTRCEAVGDIDALIDSDMRSGRLMMRHVAVEEAAAEVVDLVEHEILDELVGEAATELCAA